MDPGDIIAPLTFIVAMAIAAVTVVKIVRLRAARPTSLSADAMARLEALEQGMQSLQQDLTETQERLDFAERVLSKAREERQIGS